VSASQTTATAALQDLGQAAAAASTQVVAAVPEQQEQQQQQQQRQPSSLHQQYLYQMPHAEQQVPQLPKFVPHAKEQQPLPLLQALQLVQVRHHLLTGIVHHQPCLLAVCMTHKGLQHCCQHVCN
jgi:hemolysin activation/secretion protein